MDGMAVLHETPFQHGSNITCKHLAEQFINVIEKKSATYDTVHLIFDHYGKSITLKQKTQDRRSKGKNVDQRYYKCSDSTPVKTALDQFLRNNRTKSSLTVYLATKVLEHFKGSQKIFVISSSRRHKIISG